jgi:lipopolysaccharide export system permease protein
MPRLLTLYLAKRIALSSLLIETSLCVPVIMTSLFHYLPPAAVRGGLLMPALLGTVPTVLYISLPLAVGVAITLEFARMSSEGMIAVFYSIRLSVWSICVPALIVATIAVGVGYWFSSFVAPAYVGQMHDVIYVIRNSLNHRMLEPAQFYTFDNGSKTLYFQRWRSPDVATGVFIHNFSPEKHEEEIITAAETEFRRNDHGVLLVMTNGSIQTRPEGSSDMRTANFDEYVLSIDMQGTSGLPKRDWRGVFELSWGEFFKERFSGFQDPRRIAEWTSEATKRFGIPLLALAHGLFGIGLVLTVTSATGRGSAGAAATILAVPVLHITILIASETLVRRDPRLAFLIAGLIFIEFAVALFMIHRQNANMSPRKPMWPIGLKTAADGPASA